MTGSDGVKLKSVVSISQGGIYIKSFILFSLLGLYLFIVYVKYCCSYNGIHIIYYTTTCYSYLQHAHKPIINIFSVSQKVCGYVYY